MNTQLVCFFSTGLRKKTTAQPIFTKFGVKEAHGPQKKSLDFGGNLYHVTLGYGAVRVGVTVRWGGEIPVNTGFVGGESYLASATLVCFTRLA